MDAWHHFAIFCNSFASPSLVAVAVAMLHVLLLVAATVITTTTRLAAAEDRCTAILVGAKVGTCLTSWVALLSCAHTVHPLAHISRTLASRATGVHHERAHDDAHERLLVV